MSKPLIPLVIEAPGFLGLNSQQAGGILPVGWASRMDNFVYDDVGRMAARQGTTQLNATVVPNSPVIRSSFEYIDATASTLNIFGADNKIFKEVAGTITDISGSITTPTADNWQFANFNGAVVGYQVGHAPITMTTVGGTFIDAGGTQHNGDMVLSAYGRLWTVVANTLYHSDLLINNYTGGTSGTFDLAKFWPNGMDTAVALADFNGFLCVFGKNSIIIYGSPDDISEMEIIEGVGNLGCVARDSVQLAGKEIIFLSNTGLRTLGRTIQEKSMPISDLSKNVRDALVNEIAAENVTLIKSVLNIKKGFYLLSFPTKGLSYMFDLKFPNRDQSLKATKWDYGPTAINYTQANVMNVFRTAGRMSIYDGHKDERASDESGGSSYEMDYEGVWTDFSESGEGVANLKKILKKCSVLVAGDSGGTMTLRWAIDYSEIWNELNLPVRGNPSRFTVAHFNTIGETFAAVGNFELIKKSISRCGQVVKFGLKVVIDDSEFAIQRINVLAKLGKLGL